MDDKSRFVWIYILKDKWRSVQEVCEDYLRKKAIHYEWIVRNTPKLNGVAERMN